MNEDYPVFAGEVRSSYAVMFQHVVELYNLIYSERPDIKFEEVVEATKKLYEDMYISEYIYESLKNLYALYPELLPARVAQGYRVDESKEQVKLQDIKNLVNIMIKELNDEINDRAETIAERMLLDQEEDN